MIYPNLHGVLAARIDGLVGDGYRIPWHHSGDLKHFKKLTQGTALIIGAKTLFGIAANYFVGKEVLPGRRLYVNYQRRPGQGDIREVLESVGRFNFANVFPLAEAEDPQFDLSCVIASEGNKSPIFIAGGAKTYDRYLPYANDIYLTVITEHVRSEPKQPVYLSNGLQRTLFNDAYDFHLEVLRPTEEDGNATAEYYRASRLKYRELEPGLHSETL